MRFAMFLVCVGSIMHAEKRSDLLHAVMISFIPTVFEVHRLVYFSYSLPGLSDSYPNMVDPKCNVAQ